MSDSDDTDALLLIQPNYFMISAEEQLQCERREQEIWQESENKSQAKFTECVQYINDRLDTMLHERQNYTSASDEVKLEHNNSQQQTGPCNVLNQHNLSLHNSYMAVNCPFIEPPGSEVSTICPSEQQHTHEMKPQRNDMMLCSTPKTASSPLTLVTLKSTSTSSTAIPMPMTSLGCIRDDQMLHEIDNFLVGRADKPSPTKCTNDRKSAEGSSCTTADVGVQRLPATEELRMQMMSLGDMWRYDAPSANGGDVPQVNVSMALKEEQLRRQHLEKTVHGLQVRLLEYQQRFSVAVEVDRTKNEALSTALVINKNLTSDLEKIKSSHEKLEKEHTGCAGKLNDMQTELTNAVILAAKLEQKNDLLSQEVEDNNMKHREQMSNLKQQLEETEIKYQVSKKTEENALIDLSKLKDKLVKIEHQHDKYKTSSEELEKENETLRNQKCSLQEFHQKQKLRADALEERGKSLQEAVAKLSATETSLEKKLELQQKHLKAQYQQQLEHVVSQKLKEFQGQLDKTEQTIRNEARERERLMAERAVKQLEIMHEKNEQEYGILQQKHNEEIELYCIQLGNACKRIEKLEEYLNCYKSRRTEIAEQLHDVMETQWQKALEILISPARSQHSTDSFEGTTQHDKTHMQQSHQTPTSAKLQLGTEYSLETDFKHENSNFSNNMQHGKCCLMQQQHSSTMLQQSQKNTSNEDVVKMDRLQAYIDLLLSKSPMDVAKLDELLKTTDDNKKCTKYGKYKHQNKPPWKA